MDPLTMGLLGGLLGGGGSTQVSTTSTQSLSNAFNPSNVVNIGGGVSAFPSGNATSNPNVTANPSQSSGGGVPLVGGASASYEPNYVASTGGGMLDTLLASPVMIAGMAGAAWYFLR